MVKLNHIRIGYCLILYRITDHIVLFPFQLVKSSKFVVVIKKWNVNEQ